VRSSTKLEVHGQYDNPVEAVDNAYETPTRMDSVYWMIDEYDCIAETNEDYTGLNLMDPEIETTSSDAVPTLEEEATSSVELAASEEQTVAPEPPPPRPHQYLKLIS